MVSILQALGMFAADMFKSRSQLEAENLLLRHQFAIALRRAPDIICRLISERLSTLLGEQVVVENRPGGANVVGTVAAARAPADGYTLFFATAAALVSNPHTFKKLPYDPLKDFVAVSMVAKNPFLILANPQRAGKTLPELIAYDKANSGKLAFATDGPRFFSGIPGHMAEQGQRRRDFTGSVPDHCCPVIRRVSHHILDRSVRWD